MRKPSRVRPGFFFAKKLSKAIFFYLQNKPKYITIFPLIKLTKSVAVIVSLSVYF